MNILIDIGHPCHVHMFKCFYHEMIKKHNVVVTISDTKIIKELCLCYDIPYIALGKKGNSLISKAIAVSKQIFNQRKIIIKKKIKIAIGASSRIAYSVIGTKASSICMDDDDSSVEPLVAKFFNPLADVVLSPDVLKNENRKNVIYHNSYHELAYLHPEIFKKEETIKKELGVKENEIFFILRFNAFTAHHDSNVSGLSLVQKKNLVDTLKKYGKIFITTEEDVDVEFEKYKFPISPDKMHQALANATLFIGDSQTMATEASVLGTMNFRCNSLAKSLSIQNEQENKYGLMYNYLPKDFDNMVDRIQYVLDHKKYLESDNLLKKMLKNKINLTKLIIWFVQNYPNSSELLKHGYNSNIGKIYE